MESSKEKDNEKEKEQEKEKEKDIGETVRSFKRSASKVIGEKLNSLDVSHVFDSIDKHMKNYPFINETVRKFGLKPSYVIVPFFGFLFISLVFGWGAALICNVVGFAYPVRGAESVYNFIIRPILLKHEKAIDDYVNRISQTATTHLTQITGNLTEKLTNDANLRRRNVN